MSIPRQFPRPAQSSKRAGLVAFTSRLVDLPLLQLHTCSRRPLGEMQWDVAMGIAMRCLVGWRFCCDGIAENNLRSTSYVFHWWLHHYGSYMMIYKDIKRHSTTVIWFCVLLVPAMQSKGCLLSTIGHFQTSIDSFKRLGVWGQAGCVPAFESGLIMAYLSCTFYPLDKLNMSQASVSRNFSPDLRSWHFVFADFRGIDHLLGEED